MTDHERAPRWMLVVGAVAVLTLIALLVAVPIIMARVQPNECATSEPVRGCR